LNSHILIDAVIHAYECKHCGRKTEPPWMTPPTDIAQNAIDYFIAKHKDCKSIPLGAKAYTSDKIDHAN
jgi:hypothetical protein